MIDAVAVAHRSPERDGGGKPPAERHADTGVAPDRKHRVRQALQRRTEMNIAGEHDMRRAQPRRRRDDALANAGRIDADDRRVLENPSARPPRQRGQSVDIAAPIDLKRLRIIDAVKVAIGLKLIAHALDLPALGLDREIIVQHLQPAQQAVAGIDIGDFERALAEIYARNLLLGREGANELHPLLRQRPQFARRLEADTLDHVRDRKAKSGQHGAELMARGVPADVAAFENGNARAAPRRLQRDRQAGKPGADDADVDIQIEGKPALTQAFGIRSAGGACGDLDHVVFLRSLCLLVTLSRARACRLIV